MERLKPYNLRWFEEPLMPFDLRRPGPAQWAGGARRRPHRHRSEDHYGRHVFREMVERRCVDVLMPDLKFLRRA